MFTTCTHTLESGKTCQSPAVRGTTLCFNHTPHENIQRQSPHETEPFKLPKIHSKSGIIVAMSEVLERFAQQKIKRADARTFLYGFGLASRIMTEVDQAAAADPLGLEEPVDLSEAVSQSRPQHLKPVDPAPKPAAPWQASKEPQLVPFSTAPFNPLLRSARTKDEPSFISMLCAKAKAAESSKPTQRVRS